MKKIGYILICMAGFVAVGCGPGKNEIEPSEVVVRFHKALTSMNFSEAAGYCSDGAVQEYMDTFEAAYDEKLSKDKVATEAAATLLSKDEVVIEDTVKNKDQRTVFYTISDGCGHKKDKVAVLKKVEGAWKIAEIKDR